MHLWENLAEETMMLLIEHISTITCLGRKQNYTQLRAEVSHLIVVCSMYKLEHSNGQINIRMKEL